jgi:NTE family protein
LGADLDARSVADVLSALDSLVSAHGFVLVILDSQRPDARLLAEQMDRLVGLMTASEATRLAARLGTAAERLELALVSEPHSEHPAIVTRHMRILRSIAPGSAAADIDWLGRHLSRTKLGLALGAGGAKGYAHVAALQVLERAGYVVDYVAGSSIGAIVGCWLGLGMDADQIEEAMRREHTPESVAAMFKLSFSGFSTGLSVMTEMCVRTTAARLFEQLRIPVGVMTVDLDTRQPLLLTEGPVWQALLAATALPGMFPPFEHDGRRLVDGMALVPVPSDAVRDLGADVVVSVNLSSRDTLPVWPGEVPSKPAATRVGARLLDSLLEVLDLAQLDSSMRHAARADVTLTPRFGPCSWRDFHLADLFLAAGRTAAEAQLETLARLARPQAHASPPKQKGQLYDPTATVHV